MTDDWWPAEARRIKRHNRLVAPFVYLVRVPILMPFWLLERLGAAALKVGAWLSTRLPGFEHLPSDPKQGKRPTP